MPHAIKQISRPDRMITADEIREAILLGEIIEGYPEDQRGESCLILHAKQDRVKHVVCSPKTEYFELIKSKAIKGISKKMRPLNKNTRAVLDYLKITNNAKKPCLA